MKEILKSLRKRDWILIIISLALIVTQVWVDLKLPEFTVNITKLFNQTNTKVSKVLAQGGNLLLYSLMSVALSIVVGFLASIIAASLSMNLRKYSIKFKVTQCTKLKSFQLQA